MTYIEYFKLQAKNLFRDYKTKTPHFDDAINDYMYEYNPKYFDVDRILVEYGWDERDFTLMKAQHTIALMVGFNKWGSLLKASEAELELAKLLFDNQGKITLDDWEMYIVFAEDDNNQSFDSESRLEIFKHVFLKGDFEYDTFLDYRLDKNTLKQLPESYRR